MNFAFKQKKFREPDNTAVFTTTFVMKEQSLITLVTHELDGDWQFFGNDLFEDVLTVAMVVSLEEIIMKDKTLLQVADVPIGYKATRTSKSEKWTIAKIEYEEDELAEMGFYCSVCDLYHRDVPMAYGAQAPYQYSNIPEEELEERSELNQDFCVIDGKEFYHKGQIRIKVSEKEEYFAWNVWVSISEADFLQANESLFEENRMLQEPYSGKLATSLECYPETLGLEVKMYTQEVGLIPSIELLESDHPLFLEQENGVDMARVIEFAKTIIYGHN
ncbi:DUF2199 domain-containing protein [Rufibacter hautae]|uniref:DUF2199 domain-containing protein n=1 Tax=Rufibacter hautae TaxID=2595005 RepID=A0A5B6TJL8_9BACT|nr:DUF2199 domain-containing protein [Rufibacter hautae]KAA3439630.1 DUF2199 domain-containing protein [Rufibacter hautae]